MQHSTPRRIEIRVVAALGVWLASTGCAVTGDRGLTHQVASLPQSVRDRTHLVFVQSPIDVIRIGRLARTADYFRDLGFVNVSVAGYNKHELADRVRHVAQRHAGDRVMLVGWSAGSVDVVAAARELQPEGIGIDTVVFLDSGFVKWRLRKGTPHNVGRYALIYRLGHQPPLGLPNSQIYEVPTVNHLAIPTMPETIDILLTEVLVLSQSTASPVLHAPGVAETQTPGYATGGD